MDKYLSLCKEASDFVQVATHLIAQGHNHRLALEKQAEEAKKVVPGLVEMMKSAGFIPEGSEQKAAEMLNTYSGATTLLRNALTHLQKTAAALQKLTDAQGKTKTAGDHQSSPGEIGRPDNAGSAAAQPKRSDQALFSGLRRKA